MESVSWRFPKPCPDQERTVTGRRLRPQGVLPIRVLLFGAPGVLHGPDDSDLRPLQPKRAAVLAYLLVARSGPLHRRDTLVSMFWPERSADRGRNALSKVIYHLRRSLGPDAILAHGDQVGISREHVWCDVAAFEEALESGRMEDALALYRGELLEGFHISGSTEFDHWSDVERSRLRRRAVASAWELSSVAEKGGDGARATKYARQAVEWAPRDESGLRRLLTLLQRRGERAEALRVFESFSRRLRQDYEIGPSDPTLELVDAIRSGSLSYDLAEAAPAPEPGWPGSESASPGDSTPEQVAGSGPPPRSSLRSPAGPHRHSRPRWRFVTAALAIGLAGVFALSRSDLAPSSGVDDASEAPRVLVTEFDERTGEELAVVVTEALRVDLSQSRALDLVERPEITETLALMGLGPRAHISGEVGREIAMRDGLEAFVEGAVARVGTGYIITAAIRAGSGAHLIGTFRESIDGPDQVIAAIDRLSLGIREALGEAVGTNGASLPLERVTTPSIEALTLYTTAVRAFDRFDDRPRATGLLERAVALDPGFAMAWRMLGVTLQNEPDQTRRLEAIRQAYHHRDRLSELERYTVEASYHSVVEVDRSRAEDALLHVLRIDPENPRALNNLGVNHLYMGEPERAEGAFRRAIGLPGASSSAYRNLVETLISLGRLKEAGRALDEFGQRFPGHELLPGLIAQLRFSSGAVDEAKAELRRVIEGPLWPAARRADAWAFLGDIAYWEGRYEEARTALLEAERVGARADEARVLARAVETAHTAALVGDVDWARAHIQASLGDGLPKDAALNSSVVMSLAEVFALVFGPGQDQGVADELARVSRFSSLHARISRGDTVGVRTLIREYSLHLHRRALLFDRLGDTATAIELYEEVRRPGYTGWGDAPQLLRASIRLGPLYEEMGDTARALEAFRALSRQWADGDQYGRAVAEKLDTGARTLETETGPRRR